MNASSTLSSKGQITVPMAIRKRLGLKEGDRVEFLVENDQTILRPGRTLKNPFARFAGALPAFKDREEVIAWTRALRDGDEANDL